MNVCFDWFMLLFGTILLPWVVLLHSPEPNNTMLKKKVFLTLKVIFFQIFVMCLGNLWYIPSTWNSCVWKYTNFSCRNLNELLLDLTPTLTITIPLCPYFQWYMTFGSPSQQTPGLTFVLGHIALHLLFATNLFS